MRESLNVFIFRLRHLLRRRQLERDLEDELAFHLTMREQQLEEIGSSDPRAAARRHFGSVAYLREQCREAWTFVSIDQLWSDVRFGVRLMVKNRGLTAIVVLSLSLGIGATASIFSLLDSWILRPLAVPESGRVVRILSGTSANPIAPLSYPDFESVRSGTRSFEGVTTTWGGNQVAWLAATPAQKPRLVAVTVVDGEFFQTLRLVPAVGRGIGPDDDRVPGRDAVVVISHGLWEREFAGARTAIGRTLRINSKNLTIVGVAPRSFTGDDPFMRPEAYVPRMMIRALFGEDAHVTDRGAREWGVLARLKSGVTVDEARQDVDRVAGQLQQSYPETNRERRLTVFSQLGYRVAQNPDVVMTAGMFFLIAGLVLAIACINVALLLLSTSSARQHEIAVRIALGASRRRLVRQLLLESVMLSTAGTLGGLAIAVLGARFIASIEMAAGFPVSLDTRVDVRVILVACAVGLVSGLASGLVPAFRCSRGNVTGPLKSSDARIGGMRTPWARQAVVAIQVAAALLVLVLSGSALDGLRIHRNVDPGFRIENVLTMVFFPAAMHDAERNRSFYRQVVERVRAVPGVRAASLGYLPFGSYHEASDLTIDGYTMPRDQRSLSILSAVVAPGYFDTLAIPIMRGRAFDAHDTAKATRVAIVNEVMAAKYWPNADALNGRINILDSPAAGTLRVVGVARTIKYQSLQEQPQPFLYLPIQQADPGVMALLVVGDRDPATLMPLARRAVTDVDPDAPIVDMRTMFQHVRQRALSGDRLAAQIVTSVAAAGLTLAIFGLYGVMAYAVSQRRREIGVRIALGATSGRVLRMVLMQGLKPAAIGMLAGIPLLLVLRSIAAETFAPADPLDSLGYVVVLLLAVAAFACYVPARRASRVDPNTALRCE